VRYNIDKDLEPIARVKIPRIPKLLPLMNKVIDTMKCQSDEWVEVKKVRIPGYQGVELSGLVLEPKNCVESLPCLVVFHGGGFMLKASASHYQIMKEYVSKLPCKVVYVDYRLAPEYPFPIPVEDCYETYKWVLKHAAELGIDKNKILVSGDSAGGNLAAAVTLKAKNCGVALPVGTMLIYPVTDRRMLTDSMQRFTDTPMWDAKLNRMMWNCYLGEQKPEHIEYVSPVEAKTFQNFPPTYMEVAEYDCLHDEGIALLMRIKEAGTETELHEVKSACHGYETAVNSMIMKACMDCRLKWLQKILDRVDIVKDE